MSGEIPLELQLDQHLCETHTRYQWAAGGLVLTISTVLPERGLALELISTYVGHPHTSTVGTHLLLGPVGETALLETVEHAHAELDPIEQPRACAYDHAHQLVEALHAEGYEARIELDELTFAAFERVE